MLTKYGTCVQIYWRIGPSFIRFCNPDQKQSLYYIHLNMSAQDVQTPEWDAIRSRQRRQTPQKYVKMAKDEIRKRGDVVLILDDRLDLKSHFSAVDIVVIRKMGKGLQHKTKSNDLLFDHTKTGCRWFCPIMFALYYLDIRGENSTRISDCLTWSATIWSKEHGLLIHWNV